MSTDCLFFPTHRLPGRAADTDCLSKCKSVFVFVGSSWPEHLLSQDRSSGQQSAGRHGWGGNILNIVAAPKGLEKQSASKVWWKINFFARVVVCFCFLPMRLPGNFSLVSNLYVVFLFMLTLTNQDTQITVSPAPPISPRCSLCIGGTQT